MPVTLYNQSRIKQVGPKKNKPNDIDEYSTL